MEGRAHGQAHHALLTHLRHQAHASLTAHATSQARSIAAAMESLRKADSGLRTSAASERNARKERNARSTSPETREYHASIANASLVHCYAEILQHLHAEEYARSLERYARTTGTEPANASLDAAAIQTLAMETARSRTRYAGQGPMTPGRESAHA